MCLIVYEISWFTLQQFEKKYIWIDAFVFCFFLINRILQAMWFPNYPFFEWLCHVFIFSPPHIKISSFSSWILSCCICHVFQNGCINLIVKDQLHLREPNDFLGVFFLSFWEGQSLSEQLSSATFACVPDLFIERKKTFIKKEDFSLYSKYFYYKPSMPRSLNSEMSEDWTVFWLNNHKWDDFEQVCRQIIC